MARTINDAGFKLIREFEGCSLTAYRLSGETYYTIGYGHYGADVRKGQRITQADAEALLRSDLHTYEGYVNTARLCPVTAELNENQFSALVSFTYNCGAGSLQQLCRGRTVEQIAEHITAYCHGASSAYTAGLLRRRNAELKLYKAPVAETAQEDDEMTEEKVKEIINAFLAEKEKAAAAKGGSSWSEEARNWAAERKLFQGDEAGMHWQSPVTREQLAAVLQRMMGCKV